jgi:hypothetical protein
MSGESLHDSFSANEGGTSAKPIVKKAFGTLGKTTKLAIFIACLLLLLQVMELASSAEGAEEEEEEQIFHFGVFLMILLLCSAMVIGFFLEEHHINWLPEAGAALLLGVVAGLIIKFNQPVRRLACELARPGLTSTQRYRCWRSRRQLAALRRLRKS